MSTYIIGIDLGRQAERTALSIVEEILGPSAMKDAPPMYACRYLYVWNVGTPYTKVLDDVMQMLEREPKLRQDGSVAIDISVAGSFVAKMFKDRLVDVDVTTFKITGGATTTRASPSEISVPKQELASVLRVLLETKRFKVADGIEHGTILLEEMHHFKAEKLIDDSTIYWREKETEDLVLATAIACWLHEDIAESSWDEEAIRDAFNWMT